MKKILAIIILVFSFMLIGCSNAKYETSEGKNIEVEGMYVNIKIDEQIIAFGKDGYYYYARVKDESYYLTTSGLVWKQIDNTIYVNNIAYTDITTESKDLLTYEFQEDGMLLARTGSSYNLYKKIV